MSNCRPLRGGDARGLAMLAAHKNGDNTDDVRNITKIGDCDIYFQVWEPFPFSNTKYHLTRESDGWHLERKRKFVFSGGDGAIFSCGNDPTAESGYDDTSVVLRDTNTETGDGDLNSDGCIDTDGGLSPNVKGAVTFISKDGEHEVKDTCKTPNLLYEYSCQKYAGEETVDTMLSTFVFCNCVNGACVDKPLDLCHDPLPEDPPEGGMVWQWSTGNVVLDFCADESSVKHITCDEDGMEKQDVTPCPELTDCKEGLCGGGGCFDNDPAKDLFIKGQQKVIISGEGLNKEDWCSGPDSVTQFSCPQNSLNPITYNDIEKNTDTYKCPDGFGCDDGMCVPGTDVNKIECKSGFECEDTDVNDNPYITGAIFYKCDDPSFVVLYHTDICMNIDQYDVSYYVSDAGLAPKDVVWDFSCEAPFNKVSECPKNEFCIDGVCKEISDVECFDEDGGIVSQEYGVAYLAVADPTQYTLPWLDDFCLSPTTLVEMYCSGNDLMYQKISCGADVCAAGACRTCTDTDPQDDPSVLGYATDVEGLNHSDYCVGDKLVQVNCNAQGEVDATLAIPCDSGTCKEGVCK